MVDLIIIKDIFHCFFFFISNCLHSIKSLLLDLMYNSFHGLWNHVPDLLTPPSILMCVRRREVLRL